MKKKHLILLAACLCVGMLTACEKTPEESIVKEKGADAIKAYESGEEKDEPLKETLGVPERYTNQASYEDGALVIDTDAEVILPEGNSFKTCIVSQKEVNQELIDTVTKAFFENAKIYNGWFYHTWTREQYQEKVTLLKKYKAEGNMDPYEYGKDEEGNLIYDIDARIADYEKSMESAPEKAEKEEVTPAFGLSYPNGEKGTETTVLEASFDGVAETEQGNYDYRISNELKPDITFKIEKIRDDIADSEVFSSWIEGESFMDSQYGDNAPMSEEQVKSFIQISYEEAEKLAVEKVDKLGWNLKLYNWDYALFRVGEGEIQKEMIKDGGYVFHFTREFEGMPVTYTSSYGGGLEDMDSTLQPWGYEICNIIVGNNGIEQVEIINPYEVGEIQNDCVKLMDFDSIAKIYEQMMEVSNADVTKYEKQRTYHIRRITLGYTRIYDPAADNDTGLLVPVWNFFGGFDVEGEGYSQKDSGEHSNQSFMTINAIDGSVIDLSLGY